MIQLFNTILYEPLLNLLVFIYNILPGHDIGLAIIILTVIIKVVLWPFSWKSVESQKALQDLQPKLDALKKKYANDKAKLSQEMMALYKNQNINPASSCLPLLIQFPILIAVYQVFRSGLTTTELTGIYSFIYNPGQINAISFGFVDLAKPQAVLAVIAGIAQFWQAKMLTSKKQPKVPGAKDENITAIMNKQMMFLMPALTIFIGLSLPGGLMIYWLATTLLTIFQQYYMLKRKKKDDNVKKIELTQEKQELKVVENVSSSDKK